MNITMEKYLNTIDKHLRPLPASERIDIIKEIQGTILEMEQEGLSPEQIIKTLGTPKELAREYLSNLLTQEGGFSWKRLLTICAFYSMAGFSGLFILPVLGILAPSLLLFGILAPLAGAIKLIDYLLRLELPFAAQIGFQFGSAHLSPIPTFFASVITGILLFFIGAGLWKLLVYYCKTIGKAKTRLSI